ncbi:hypothetical protein FG386_003222 [Cryptosporidium ryanae]|uniref:uncharacterized protein n=1 Tax=Cryptosporidium ryanae TaxID=515981 RepID=UPI00351A598F|nr:hypothetical protein FG386_003222 [Cryptosporidium ryanae]
MMWSRKLYISIIFSIFANILTVFASIVDIPWPVSTNYILSSLETAQQIINNSRVLTLDDFVDEHCKTSDYYPYIDNEYSKEMWEWFISWHSDSSVLAGMILENLIVLDSKNVQVDVKPLLSEYFDKLIWREIVSCVIFGISIFLFILVALAFVLCRVLNDRVISFEETTQGLWKIKLSIYMLILLLCILSTGYIMVSIVTIVNFVNFSFSFSSSVCWLATGVDALSNGNININTTSGGFNVVEASLRTNTTIPFIGTLPLYGLFQELASVEAINGLVNSTFDYIDSVGFSTSLSQRLSDMVTVFTNTSLIKPANTKWSIPSGPSLSVLVNQAASSFLPVRDTLYNSMVPILSEIVSLAKSVDTSSMTYSVSAYFDVFQEFIRYTMLFIMFSKTGSNTIFTIITTLCSCSIFVGILTIVFSILHIKLFLSGRSHIGFFQSRSALVAVAFIILGFSTIFSFITYTLTIAGTVGKDYCAWVVKDLFSTTGMNWISTIGPEIGMVFSICLYPLATYIRVSDDNNTRELDEVEFYSNRIRLLEEIGISDNTNKYYDKLKHNYEKIISNINDTNKHSEDILKEYNFSLNSETFNNIDNNRKLGEKPIDLSKLGLKSGSLLTKDDSKNSILLAEQYKGKKVYTLLSNVPANNSMSILFYALLPGNLVLDLANIVPEYLNIASTTLSIAEQSFTYVNVTDYIKFSLMYLPDTQESSSAEQEVPVLVLITQSYFSEKTLTKNSIFGYTTYSSLCSSSNNDISTLMISSQLPVKIPGLETLQTIIEPFKIKPLVGNDPIIKTTKSESNDSSLIFSEEQITDMNMQQFQELSFEPLNNTMMTEFEKHDNLVIDASTNFDELDLDSYYKMNKYFTEYPISSYKETLEWVKKLAKLYDYKFYCYPFSWVDIERIKADPNTGNNTLYLEFHGKECNYLEFERYITSIGYDYLINPTNIAFNEVKRLYKDINHRIKSMLGSAMILKNIRTEAHNCGQVSVDSTNAIVTFCGMIGRTKDTLIILLNVATFIGFAISIIIGAIWIISLRYESRISDSILEMEQSSNESEGNSDGELSRVDLKINTVSNLPVKNS